MHPCRELHYIQVVFLNRASENIFYSLRPCWFHFFSYLPPIFISRHFANCKAYFIIFALWWLLVSCLPFVKLHCVENLALQVWSAHSRCRTQCSQCKFVSIFSDADIALRMSLYSCKWPTLQESTLDVTYSCHFWWALVSVVSPLSYLPLTWQLFQTQKRVNT